MYFSPHPHALELVNVKLNGSCRKVLTDNHEIHGILPFRLPVLGEHIQMLALHVDFFSDGEVTHVTCQTCRAFLVTLWLCSRLFRLEACMSIRGYLISFAE